VVGTLNLFYLRQKKPPNAFAAMGGKKTSRVMRRRDLLVLYNTRKGTYTT
jgi:hypothetical protein